ncbi:MAG: hypothetical protein M0Z25_00280 [Nitrospiraceae bacterium]|nr:hypothetical protein [Nitrospiraceae bacterium]
MAEVRILRKLLGIPETIRVRELWGSLFDLWFLIPLAGLMVDSEQGGTAQILGRDLLGMGGAWLLSALLFRTPLPLQPLKVWAFLFLLLRPTPLVASLSAVLLGLLLFLAGQSGLSTRLEAGLSAGTLARIRRAVGLYVRAIAIFSLGVTFFRHCPSALPSDLLALFPVAQVKSPGTLLSVLLLVLPQFPVTLVNGVLSTVRERRESGGLSADARRLLTGKNLSRWLGLADLSAGLLGVLPFCHGSGNLWVYRRHGVRSVLAPLVSSIILIGLGTILLRRGAILPSPMLCGSFLAGFLLVEFFEKRKEKSPAGEPGPGGRLSGPLELWAVTGGMVSGSLLLGGLPLLLAFLLGMNAAIFVSPAMAGENRGPGLIQPGEGQEPVHAGRHVMTLGSGGANQSLGPDHPAGASSCPSLPVGSPESSGPVLPGQTGGISPSHPERFFRRAREIPVGLFLLLLLFLVPLLSGETPRTFPLRFFPPNFFFRSVPVRAP